MNRIRRDAWPRKNLALKHARKALGLSQAELAKRSGVSQSQISRLENGRQGSDGVAEMLAPHLGCLATDLLIFDAGPKPASERQKQQELYRETYRRAKVVARRHAAGDNDFEIDQSVYGRAVVVAHRLAAGDTDLEVDIIAAAYALLLRELGGASVTDDEDTLRIFEEFGRRRRSAQRNDTPKL